MGKLAKKRSGKGLGLITKALPFIEVLGFGLATMIETEAVIHSAYEYYDKNKMLEVVGKLEKKIDNIYPAMQLVSIEEDPLNPLPENVKHARAQILEEYRLANNLCEYFSTLAKTDQNDAVLTMFTSGTNAGLAITGLLSTLGIIGASGGIAIVAVPIVMSVIALSHFIHDKQQAKTEEEIAHFNKTYGDFANTPEGMFAALYFMIKKEIAEKEASDKLEKESGPTAKAGNNNDNKYSRGLMFSASAHAHNPVHQEDANLDKQPFSNYILPLLGVESPQQFISLVDHGLELSALNTPDIQAPNIQSAEVQTAFPHIIRKTDPEARKQVRDLAAKVELTAEIVGQTAGDQTMKDTLSDLMLIQNGYDTMIKRCELILDNLDESNFKDQKTIDTLHTIIDELTALREKSLIRLDQCLQTFDNNTQLMEVGKQKAIQENTQAPLSYFESAKQYVQSFFEEDTKTTLAEKNETINQLAEKVGVKFPPDMDPQNAMAS